jgi:hypothetical protein
MRVKLCLDGIIGCYKTSEVVLDKKEQESFIKGASNLWRKVKTFLRYYGCLREGNEETPEGENILDV